MTSRVVRVGNRGQISIPAEIRSALGIKTGTRISIGFSDSRIILQVVSKQLVDQTRGMLKGRTSLWDEMKRERQTDKW
jgi:AbrB family looped-hinge helix DNA binding protein